MNRYVAVAALAALALAGCNKHHRLHHYSKVFTAPQPGSTAIVPWKHTYSYPDHQWYWWYSDGGTGDWKRSVSPPPASETRSSGSSVRPNVAGAPGKIEDDKELKDEGEKPIPEENQEESTEPPSDQAQPESGSEAPSGGETSGGESGGGGDGGGGGGDGGD